MTLQHQKTPEDCPFSQHEIPQLSREVAVLAERMDRFMKESTTYRESLCGKLEKVVERLNSLNCVKHSERINQNTFQIRTMWGAIGAITIAIVLDWLKAR